jgi:glycosidase
MVYSLAFSLPGTPVLFYGEEIGMGENLEIEGRMSVRSPMQWTAGPTGGFSDATPEDLCRPLTRAPGYGPDDVNASAQRRHDDSLLNWFERLIRSRKECPELGWGRFTLLPTAEPAVFAHRSDWDDRALIAVHNLAGADRRTVISLDDADRVESLEDLFREEELRPDRQGRVELALEPYAHRWLRVHRPGRRRAL